jgi:hypothetical protein
MAAPPEIATDVRGSASHLQNRDREGALRQVFQQPLEACKTRSSNASAAPFGRVPKTLPNPVRLLETARGSQTPIGHTLAKRIRLIDSLNWAVSVYIWHLAILPSLN